MPGLHIGMVGQVRPLPDWAVLTVNLRVHAVSHGPHSPVQSTSVPAPVSVSVVGSVCPSCASLQQLVSFGVVAAALDVSYTRPLAEAHAKWYPPSVVSPHEATNAGAMQQLASFGFVAAALDVSYTRPLVESHANSYPSAVVSPHEATNAPVPPVPAAHLGVSVLKSQNPEAHS